MHLVAQGVAFAYPEHPVFEQVDVRVSAGRRLGVVGENGSGKSTLLRVLAGQLQPSAGAVRRRGSLALVAQELEVAGSAVVGDLVEASLTTVREAVRALQESAARMGPPAVTCDRAPHAADAARYTELVAHLERLEAWDAPRRLDVALTRLGAERDLSRPLHTMSIGERYRVRLACRLAEDTDLLLLDEPTNHLDDAAIAFLTRQIHQWRGGVVLVTHDRTMLDDVVTGMLDLDPSMDGRPGHYGVPGYWPYRLAKDAMLARWRQRYAAERTQAERLSAHLDQAYEGLSDEWRPPKGSRKHRRATRARSRVKATDRRIEHLEATAVTVPVPPSELVFPDLPTMPRGADGARPLVEVRGPRVMDGNTVRLDLRGARIDVPAAGRLLVTGPNGAGKSTLLQVIAGRLALDAGLRVVAPRTRFGVLGQEEEEGFLAGETTGFDLCGREALALLERGELDPDQVVTVGGVGLLTEAELDRPVRELSTGQRRRLALLRALVAAPHVLVLDEPTNHLSIDLVDGLTRALRATSAAVVVATHDRRMRSDLADWPRVELGAS